METFTLEYNETQQAWHNNYGNSLENTNGWFTVFRNCTDREFEIFEAYVNRTKKRKITKIYLGKCIKELKGFMEILKEYKLEIKHI